MVTILGEEVEDMLSRVPVYEQIAIFLQGLEHHSRTADSIVEGYTMMIEREIAKFKKGESNDVGALADSIQNNLNAISSFPKSGSALVSDAFEHVPTDLSEIVKESFKLFDGIHRITIEGFYPPDITRKVNLDPNEIKVVLRNLYSNCLDAIPDKGVVTVKVKNAQVSPFDIQQYLDYHKNSRYTKDNFPLKPGVYVQLRVHDGGSGMDEITRTRMAIPFFRASDQPNCQGLGFSEVYFRIYSEHNQGKIFVNSGPEKGTTIEIYFPVADQYKRIGDFKVPDKKK